MKVRFFDCGLIQALTVPLSPGSGLTDRPFIWSPCSHLRKLFQVEKASNSFKIFTLTPTPLIAFVSEILIEFQLFVSSTVLADKLDAVSRLTVKSKLKHVGT